jgi:DNA-directed RNA polymerase specialized sigma24 family protein
VKNLEKKSSKNLKPKVKQRHQKPKKSSAETPEPLEQLSETQILACINYVVDYLSPGFVFRPFDLDDVKQEGRAAALKAMPGFDQNFKKSGTIEEKLRAYLFTHVKRRLINFKRDEHGNKEEKYMLKNYASSIYGLDDSHESQILIEEDEGAIDRKIMQEKILLNLEPEYRHDYHKMLAGTTIPKIQREKLLKRLREILGATELQSEE